MNTNEKQKPPQNNMSNTNYTVYLGSGFFIYCHYNY